MRLDGNVINLIQHFSKKSFISGIIFYILLYERRTIMRYDQIAAQLYTIREFLQTQEDIYNSLKKIKEIGYQAVQISGMAKIETKILKNMLDEFSLIVCATHIPFDRLKNELDVVIAEHKALECKHIAIPSVPSEFRTKDGTIKFGHECEKIAKKLKEDGITLSYHNHSFEFIKYDGKTWLEIFYENTDPNLLEAEIDTYWVQFAGANPEKWIKKLKGRMSLIHLKDMQMIDEKKQAMAEIGNGNLDWEGIVAACEDANMKWYIIEQDICQRDPFESLKISLDYLAENFVK